MSARSLAVCLLLALAAVSAVELAMDSATFHVPIRQQWRVQTREQAAVRLPQRNTIGIPGDWPAAPILTLTGVLVLLPRFDFVSPPLAAVFVPPRA